MERYNSTCTKGVHRREHLLIWEAAHGPIPKGYVIHHKNGDGRDNRLENLEMMTNREHLILHHKLRREGIDPVDANNHCVILDRERQRRAHAKYRETHKEQIKAYYKEHREEAIARVKAYVAAHRDEVAAKSKIYRAKNKDKMAAYQKVYRAEHHDEKLASEKIYRETHRAEVSLGKKICYAVKKGHPQDEILRMRAELKAMREKRKLIEE